MTEKPYSFPPFLSPLEPATIPEVMESDVWKIYIYQLRDNPEIIVRRVEGTSYLFADTQENVLRVAKKEFDLLRKKYNIPVSANFVLVGARNGPIQMYAIADRVYKGDEQELQKTDSLVELSMHLLQYCFDKIQSYVPELHQTDNFLYDIGMKHQYIYGFTAEDRKNTYRLVDIDPEHVSSSVGDLLYLVRDVLESIAQDTIVSLRNRGDSTDCIVGLVQSIMDELDHMNQNKYLDLEQSRLEEVRKVARDYFLASKNDAG